MSKDKNEGAVYEIDRYCYPLGYRGDGAHEGYAPYFVGGQLLCMHDMHRVLPKDCRLRPGAGPIRVRFWAELAEEGE